MKKILLSLTLFIGAFSTSQAQEVHPCHTVEKTQEYLSTLSPSERAEYEEEQAEYQLDIQEYIDNNPHLLTSNNGNQRAIQYTLPVVFHIIHEGGPENISNEQVMNALNHMNEDYQKSNATWSFVNSQFLPIVADVEIEFKLAKLDNNGNCTNGITRTYSSITNGGSGTDRIAAVQAQHGNWPGNKYINIFVAKDIGGAAGYTYRPSNSGFTGTTMNNGIHVLHNYVGSIGTSSSSGTHTLTHEVGHWLDLPHTWGGTNDPGLASNCNDDDGVADTPQTIGWTTCNTNGTSCGSLDNVENFMEYSYCSKMFTNGQKARMHAALDNSVGGRNNVHSAANLTATGVNLPDVMCQADFMADRLEVCAGGTVNFQDLSYSGPTGWSWTFSGGSPSTSTSQNPSVTYNTPGTYEVSLTADDGSNSRTETKTGYITVLPTPATLPVMESFEGMNSLTNSFWNVADQGSNARFDISTSAGYTGSNSVVLSNFGQVAGNIDELISNPIDLSPVATETTLSFRYAYRKRSDSNDEWLRVLISNNCGDNWTTRKTLRGDGISELTYTSGWTPSSQEEWVTVHMTNITSAYWTSNFRFKFQFESDGGNNLYLDDINIYEGSEEDEPLSVEDEGLIKAFNVYPNPADEEANVTFSLENSQNVNVTLTNMMGQTIQSNTVHANTGKNLVMINTSNVEAGIYLVSVNIGGSKQVKRLIIK
ncbi:M43 family zinc metalloprotease [Brumimicrobium aurantiacum]|nr:M43 family zinc metalloprotease [Brumimicrobium aurantiacum]